MTALTLADIIIAVRRRQSHRLAFVFFSNAVRYRKRPSKSLK
jgi:hypothetical protein